MTEFNGRPTWHDLTDSINGLRTEMHAGFDRLEQRMRWVITTAVAVAVLAVMLITAIR